MSETELKPVAWFFRWPGSTSWRNSDVDPTGRIPNEQFATVLCAYDHEDIAAALSAAEARGREAAWNTMDSAPKDGTRVWLFQANHGSEQFVGWFERTADGWYWQDEGDTEPEPTHWRPLPDTDAIRKGLTP